MNFFTKFLKSKEKGFPATRIAVGFGKMARKKWRFFFYRLYHCVISCASNTATNSRQALHSPLNFCVRALVRALRRLCFVLFFVVFLFFFVFFCVSPTLKEMHLVSESFRKWINKNYWNQSKQLDKPLNSFCIN